MEHWINLPSNNCNYKKQMFLLNDKLYTLSCVCVIIVNKPRLKNININRIYRIASFNNITTNTSITEATCKSPYQSTNEPSYEPTHAHISAQSASSIQSPATTIITGYNDRNLKYKLVHNFFQSTMPDFYVVYVFNVLCILCKIVHVCSF